MDTTNQIKEQFSFVTGAVRRKGLIYLAATDDEATDSVEAHFLLLAWFNGEWIHAGGRTWPAVAVDISLDPVPQMAVVGPLGEAAFSGSDDDHDETVENGEYSASHLPQALAIISVISLADLSLHVLTSSDQQMPSDLSLTRISSRSYNGR